LDVVVGQGAAILQLLASKDQALLVWGNTLLILDLRLDIIDGVGRLNLEGDGLASQGLDDCGKLVKKEQSNTSGSLSGGRVGVEKRGAKRTDLHTTTETEDQVESRFLLNVVVGEGATILQLLAGEDQALLVRRNALLVLNLGLDIIDGVAGLHLKGDSLASDCVRERGRVSRTALGGERGCATRRPEKTGKLTGLHEDLHDGGSSTMMGGTIVR
jgi:hypothetical protein